MNKVIKTLLKILNGRNDSNIEFIDVVHLLFFLEFEERIKGSHHIFSKSGIVEIINLQPNENNKCKAYQVKQVRNIIVKYKLGDATDEQV
ncbi:MAG: type II toxin-antitoxin system HicA family toxin [Ignavibacteria bacterium]|nr:type II toxin-antitoxin system HicA family toxin [Ignavibacteria bacterium]